jgi:hypothetical protein
MEIRKMCQGLQISFLSFRASEARHGIQYFKYFMDTGLRRYDDVDDTLSNYDIIS